MTLEGEAAQLAANFNKEPVKTTKHEVRLNLAKEIFETEQTYVDNLKVLQELYIIPLLTRSGSSAEILTGDQIQCLFSSIQVITSLNGKFLHDLEKRLNEWHSTTIIGDLFIEFAPFFKMYTEFVNNHDQATTLLKDLMRSKTHKAKKFQKFAENCDKHPKTGGLSLQSFLIMPIQRIPRYELLLRELWLNSSPQHQDHKLLTKALTLVKKVANHINEEVRNSDNRQQIQKIQERFHGEHVLVAPHRLFIREGMLLRKTRGASRPFTFFLFNDLLIYAVEKFGRFKLHQSIPINAAFDIAPVEAENNPENERYAWQIISAVKSFVVCARDEAEQRMWIGDLSKCVDEFKKTVMSTNTGESLSPVHQEAVLQSVQDAQTCRCCKRPFNFIVRRHHCKACGYLVCADCSQTRMMIPNSKWKKPQRACEDCVSKQNRESVAARKEIARQNAINTFERLVNRQTDELNVPPMLQPPISPELFDLDQWVWLPHEDLGFVPAKLTDEKKQNHFFETIYRERVVLPSTDELARLPQATANAFFSDMDDLIQLEDFSEGSILHQLRIRYQKDKIYTNIGGVLVAINPFKMLPIYTSAVMDQYKNRYINNDLDDEEEDDDSLPPHVFEIASDAYRGLISEQENQAIIISGESGAGKTETTKLILLCLSEMGGSEAGVEQDILNSSPILEAFGNAKTVQNNNSSRFGKYVEVRFSKGDTRICGANIRNYLLEKSRVVFQAPSERNFHIFYQLCSAAVCYYNEGADMSTDEGFLLNHLQLGASSDFHYLHQSDCQNIEGVSDDEDFEETIDALKRLKISMDEICHMLQLLATVLHIGNLELIKKGDKGSIVSNRDILHLIQQLSGMDMQSLEHAVCFHSITVVGETASMPLPPDKAVNFRDALAKSLYNQVFDWLVKRINFSLRVKQDEEEEDDYETGAADPDNLQGLQCIGVLDIYGFEVFENNSLEQFFINYANEVLQQHFNYHIFKQLQEEYEKDGVAQTNIEFIDNTACLSLIESRSPAGVLIMLDEEIKMPHCSDSTFARRMHETFHENQSTRHDCYDRLMKFPMLFIVKHYAGQVTYNVSGFVEKNKDKLQPAFEELLAKANYFIRTIHDPATNSGVPIINSEMSIHEEFQRNSQYPSSLYNVDKTEKSEEEPQNTALISPKGPKKYQTPKRTYTFGASKSHQAKMDTLSIKFRSQLETLMATLKATHPSFIRCIKPNDFKMADNFDSQLVLRQMRNGGLFETIRIRREGYPKQSLHADFVRRFSCILSIASPKRTIRRGANDRHTCLNLIQSFKELGSVIEEDLIIGRTKVFWRISQDRIIEQLRREAMDKAAIIIQNSFRTILQRKLYLKFKGVALELRSAILSRNSQLLQNALQKADDIGAQSDLINGYTQQIRTVQNEIAREQHLIEQFELGITKKDKRFLHKAIRHAHNLHPEGRKAWPNVKQDLVVAMYDYDAQESNELTFKTNDVIEVLGRPVGDQWWIGQMDEKKGSFPSNYTEQAPPPPDAAMREDPQSARFWDLLAQCEELENSITETTPQTPSKSKSESRFFGGPSTPGRPERPDYPSSSSASEEKDSHLQEVKASEEKEEFTEGGLPKSLAQRYAVFLQQTPRVKLSDYGELRSESDYVKGMFMQRKKRKEMLRKRFVFQKEMIPRSINKFSKEYCGSEQVRDNLRQLAIQNFNNILGYMKSKYHAYPETNGHAVVKCGFREPLMRDEIYAQLVKQTTEAPSTDQLLGWKLIFLCLNSFMPTLKSSHEYSPGYSERNDTGSPPFCRILLGHINKYCHPNAAFVSSNYQELGFSSVLDVATHCYFQYMANLQDEFVAKMGAKMVETSIVEVIAVTSGKLETKPAILRSPDSNSPSNSSSKSTITTALESSQPIRSGMTGPKSGAGSCKNPKCSRRAVNQGLCSQHYANVQRAAQARAARGRGRGLSAGRNVTRAITQGRGRARPPPRPGTPGDPNMCRNCGAQKRSLTAKFCQKCGKPY